MLDFEYLAELFTVLPSMQRGLIAVIFIAFSSSLLGVTLILKRLSFIGDGLSHVSFFAVAIAALANIKDDLQMVIILPITLVCSLLLICTGRNAKLKGDAALAMISVGTIAAGYMIMTLTGIASSEICEFMFGLSKIMLTSEASMWTCIAVSLVVGAFFVFFYNKIFTVTFDDNFTQATGTKVNVYNAIIAVLVAVVITIATKLVGSMLLSALIIFPALSSMRVFKNFKAVTICSVILSVVCATLGVLIAYSNDLPIIGIMIIVVNIAAFFVFWLIGFILAHVKGGAKA